MPALIGGAGPDSLARRSPASRARAPRTSPVVAILDAPRPTHALRTLLAKVDGIATPQQAQVALGAAQLLLVDFERERRGGAEVRELVDLVLAHWEAFGDRRRGFHAQEFLRYALAAVGVDRERVERLEVLVPDHATSELLFSLACACAVVRDRAATLRAAERALEAGASAGAFRREPDFAPYARDPEFARLLARAELPPIPVRLDQELPAVRSALGALRSTLAEFGVSLETSPPARLDAILDAERAARVSLPNDVRALLTITNGMRLWDHAFLATVDLCEPTRVAAAARQFLDANLAIPGLIECVPIARWGQPGEWLLHDPRGRLRGGVPGYVLIADGAVRILDTLADALGLLEELAREILATN